MKIKAICLGLILAAAAAAAAQTFTVLLNNPEGSDFHFVLDPPELAGLDPASTAFADGVYAYFAESPGAGGAKFENLPAGTTRRLEKLAEGTHLLIGFFAPLNRGEFPVRTLVLKAGGGVAERFYSVYAQPVLFKAKAGRGRLAAFPAGGAEEQAGIRIDNNYEDWEAIPVFRSFADYRPRTFTRERIGGGRLELPLEQSLFWPKGGTGLADLKLLDDGKSLFVFVSTRSAIAEGLSIYLYFRQPHDPEGENRVTVELLPATNDKQGLPVLWVKDHPAAAIGSLASHGFLLEAELDRKAIYGALDSDPRQVAVELTTAYYDRASLAHEEFYYAMIALSDVPID
jgi:hypothetical protein